MAAGMGLVRGQNQYEAAAPPATMSRPTMAHTVQRRWSVDRGDGPLLIMAGAHGKSNSMVTFDSTVTRDGRNGDLRHRPSRVYGSRSLAPERNVNPMSALRSTVASQSPRTPLPADV